MKWYPKACPVCSGDLHDDLQEDDCVSCLMCGRSFEARDVLAVQRALRAVSVAARLSEAA